AGGEFGRDFVVGALTTTLTSPHNYKFDPQIGGFGAGQLVQGSGNAFDGLNRLQVGGTDFAPATSMSSLVSNTGVGLGYSGVGRHLLLFQQSATLCTKPFPLPTRRL